MDCPRGRSSGRDKGSINGLVFIRGQHEDFSTIGRPWAAGAGVFRDCVAHFRAIETYFRQPPSQYRGAHGLCISRNLRTMTPPAKAWLEAAQSLGFPIMMISTVNSTYGVGPLPLTLKGPLAATVPGNRISRTGRASVGGNP